MRDSLNFYSYGIFLHWELPRELWEPGCVHMIATKRNWTLLDSGLLSFIHFTSLLCCTTSLHRFAFYLRNLHVFFFSKYKLRLDPWGEFSNIPEQPAELGWWLRKHRQMRRLLKFSLVSMTFQEFGTQFHSNWTVLFQSKKWT